MNTKEPSGKIITKLLAIGYMGDVKNWFDIKIFLWKAYQIEIVTYCQDNDKRNRFTVSFEDDIAYEVPQEEFNSPIVAEIEGIKNAIEHLYKQRNK